MKHIFLFIFAAMLFTGCTKPDREDRYTIAFNIHVPDTTRDDWDILAMNMDGSGQQNITNNPDVAWTYHASKDRLFFISDRDTCYRCFFLYECDGNGKNIRRVSDLRLEDSWMSSRKEGAELVVSGRPDRLTRFQLFLINTSTGAFTQITQDTVAMYRDPCFSPDGKQMVVSYKRVRKDRSAHEELYLMNADGTGLTQLTHYPEENPSAKEYGYRAGAARWHPTENFISYVSKQDGRHSIFAITPDGQRQWKLIENPESEGWHDWSPDGRWLVFNGSDAAENHFHIELMNWETKERRVLTDSTVSALGPVFVSQ